MIRETATGKLAEQLAGKLADLRIRQLFTSSASETRFKTMESIKPFYYFPIPNNQSLRLYPLRSNLIETLTAQSIQYTALNNCCYALAKCSNIHYAADTTKFDEQAHKTLDLWNKSIAEHVYLNASGFFRIFCSQCKQSIDISSIHYSPLESFLELLPPGLIGTWQLSIISLKSDLEALLIEINDCHLFNENLLHFVEIRDFEDPGHQATEIVKIYIDAGLDGVDLLSFIGAIQKYRYFLKEGGDGHSQIYSYVLEPGFSIQQGFIGLKKFLSAISRLDSYYIEESGYSLSRKSDFQLLRQWTGSRLRSSQPERSFALDLDDA